MKKRLSEFIRIKHGYAFKSANFSRSGEYILLTPGNFKETGGFRTTKPKFYVGPIPQEYVLKKGDFIIAMTEQAPGLLGAPAIIPEGRHYLHNQRLGLVDFVNKELSREYLFHLLNESTTRKAISTTAGGTKVRHTSPSKIEAVEVYIPTIAQQVKIALLLNTWDSVIEKSERLIERYSQKYAALAAMLYPYSNTSAIGSLSDFCTEIGTRNRGKSTCVLSVTNHSGFVLPEEQFAKRVASEDLSNYKVIRKGQYAYNPSRINVGSIARLDSWDMGVLSPMYTVFSLDEERVDSDYFLHWLESPRAKSSIAKSAQGSVRRTVAYSAFSELEIPLPKIAEQRRIARALNDAQSETRILQALVDRYRREKTFLMSKLLSGEWEAPNLGAEAN